VGVCTDRTNKEKNSALYASAALDTTRVIKKTGEQQSGHHSSFSKLPTTSSWSRWRATFGLPFRVVNRRQDCLGTILGDALKVSVHPELAAGVALFLQMWSRAGTLALFGVMKSRTRVGRLRLR